MVIAPYCEVELRPRPIYIWDLSSNRFQEIGNFSKLRLCHVDMTENVLVAFEVDLGEEPSEVCQTRWTTTGQLLEKKILHLAIPVDQPLDRLLTDPDPGSTFGNKSVTELFFAAGKHPTVHLEYDHAAGRFKDWRISPPDNLIKNGLAFDSIYLTPYLVYRWIWETGHVVVYNAATKTPTLHPTQLPDSTSNLIIPEPPRSYGITSRSRKFCAFGDRDVLCVVNHTGVQLWFFNPNFASDSIPNGKHSVIE